LDEKLWKLRKWYLTQKLTELNFESTISSRDVKRAVSKLRDFVESLDV